MAEYFIKDGDDYKKVDENLLSQTQVDDVIEKRLERERGKYADYDTLKEKAVKVDTIAKEFEDKLKTKDTEVSELTKSLGSAKLETEKVKIVHEFKLSDELSEFVTGDTADAMRAKAEKLAKGVTGGKVTVSKSQKPGGKPSDSKELAKGLFGKKSD
jgi:hypothetical protein